MSVGAAFCFFVLVAAMMPDTFWGNDISNTVAAATPGNPDPRLDAGAGPGDARSLERNPDGPGLVPFSRAASERFRGKVVRTVSLGSDTGWGQIHIWVDNGSGPSREVSVAPNWYLQHLGCSIADNSRVQGVAFRYSKSQPDAELYAKNITIDGKSCRLRNDDGFALWSNRLR